MSEVKDCEDENDNIGQQTGGTFTPQKGAEVDTSKFRGVSIRQLPKDTDPGKVIELLVGCGLPETKRETVAFDNRGGVLIKDLENAECLAIIEKIHGKTFFEKKLFCNGFVPLTPEKIEASVQKETSPVQVNVNKSPPPPL